MITNNLLTLNYEESMSIEAKLKYLQNTFDSIQPEIIAAIDKARTLIPTIDGKVTQLFNEWVASGEFNDVILQELQPLISQFPGIITGQNQSVTSITNQNINNTNSTTPIQEQQQNNQVPIQSIQTIITNVNNSINTLTSEYGVLYSSYLNIRNVYNQVVADTATHTTVVDAISTQITQLYGNIIALLNLVNSFNNSTDFYSTFSQNFNQVLNEFSTSVSQNATDITNLTNLLNDYQTPINNANQELETITSTYQAEIQQWQAFLAAMDTVDNAITQAQNLMLTLNAKVSRDEENISNNASIIATLPTNADRGFTPTFFDVTSQSLFATASSVGSATTVGYWQVGVNKFILVINATVSSAGVGIQTGQIIAPLPTPLQDANFLPTYRPVIIPIRSASSILNFFTVTVTPWGLRANTPCLPDGTSAIFLNEYQFFMVGTV